MELGNNNCHARRLSGRMGEYHDTQTGTRAAAACIGSLDVAYIAGWTLLPSNTSGIVDLHTRIALDAPDGSKAGQSPADAPPQDPTPRRHLSLLLVSAIVCRDSPRNSLRNIALLGESGVCSNARGKPAFRNACEPCFRAGRCTRVRELSHRLPRGCRG